MMNPLDLLLSALVTIRHGTDGIGIGRISYEFERVLCRRLSRFRYEPAKCFFCELEKRNLPKYIKLESEPDPEEFLLKLCPRCKDGAVLDIDMGIMYCSNCGVYNYEVID